MVVVDDLVHDYCHYYFGLNEYFEQYAMDLHLESYLVAFQSVFPVNVDRSLFLIDCYYMR